MKPFILSNNYNKKNSKIGFPIYLEIAKQLVFYSTKTINLLYSLKHLENLILILIVVDNINLCFS